MSQPKYWAPVMLNWELDMLECTLFENYDRVHKFVVVEATLTHQGRPKPLYYDDNKSRFEQYADKIIHVVCDYLPTNDQLGAVTYEARYQANWSREKLQRDAGNAAFMPRTDSDDIVIVSDLDEIPSSSAFAQDPAPFLGGRTAGRFATVDTPTGPGVMQVLARAGAIYSVDQLRVMRESFPSYDYAGWHLSWLGGQAAIAEKLECFCHLETYDAGVRANNANVMWLYGMGGLPENWDGAIERAPVLDIPYVKTREERDALPWEQQAPLWVHQRLCPEVWWRPKEETGDAPSF